MNLNIWLDNETGRTKAMAEHFGVTMGAITQWRVKAPIKRVREISDFTGGEVTITELLWPELESETA